MPALLLPPCPTPPVDDATRRDLLKGAGLLSVAGLLTACGVESPAAPANVEDDLRPWQGDDSQTRIPVSPQRVAMLDTIGTDLAATLGLADLVVGYVRTDAGIEGYQVPQHWVGVGTESAPDLETVAGLAPDLIVAWDGDPDVFGRLTKIAPVASIPDHGPFGWREYWVDLGDVLGRREAAQGYVAGIDRRIGELAGRIPDGASLSLLRVNQDGLGVYPGFYPVDLIRDLGFATPPGQAMDPSGDPCCVDVSLERLTEHDADHVFVAVDDSDDARRQLDRITASPLWTQLAATRESRLHTVRSGHWIQWGPSSVSGALDDVATHVVRS